MKKMPALAFWTNYIQFWLFKEEIAPVDSDSCYRNICHTIYWFHEEYNEEGLLIWVAEVAGTIIVIAKVKASLTRAQPEPSTKFKCTSPLSVKHVPFYKKRLNDLNIAISMISPDT